MIDINLEKYINFKSDLIQSSQYQIRNRYFANDEKIREALNFIDVMEEKDDIFIFICPEVSDKISFAFNSASFTSLGLAKKAKDIETKLFEYLRSSQYNKECNEVMWVTKEVKNRNLPINKLCCPTYNEVLNYITYDSKVIGALMDCDGYNLTKLYSLSPRYVLSSISYFLNNFKNEIKHDSVLITNISIYLANIRKKDFTLKERKYYKMVSSAIEEYNTMATLCKVRRNK